MMRLFRILFSLVMMVLFTVASPAAAQDDISWLLDHINCLRQSVGSPPLTMNVALSIAANQQSVNLANDALTDFHVGLDGSTPTTRTRDAGFTGSIGENVASGRQVSDVFNWWLNSPIHYDNMTNVHWKEIGIGMASGPHGIWYTLDFGAATWDNVPLIPVPCNQFDVPDSPVNNNGTLETANQAAPSIPTAAPNTAIPAATPIILGLDENGYIQHVIQSGETPGTIMLSYGYAWEDLPMLMTLNHMTEADARNLDVGDIFLVPPKEGILTPTPVPDLATEEVSTPLPDDDAGLIILVISDKPDVPSERIPASSTPLATLTVSPTVTLTLRAASTLTAFAIVPATLVPPVAFSPSLTPTRAPEMPVPTVALVASATPTIGARDLTLLPVALTPIDTTFTSSESPATDERTPLLLTIAIVLQVIILGVAIFEGVRRWRKRG